jgi:predicted RNA-binding protein YlqC (UPF0109 family)
MVEFTEITDTLRAIVTLMVDSPQDVVVKCFAVEGGASIHIAVAPTDLGKVIGKQGRHARALRVIAGAMGMTIQQRISMDVTG